MRIYIFSGLVLLCLVTIVAQADTATAQDGPGKYKEPAGLGIGALVGGLIAGPPGVIIGAAGGAWYGNKEARKDRRLAGLRDDVAEKNTELAIMEQRLTDLREQFGSELQKVSRKNRISALDDLSQGVSLAIYFRTGSAEIAADSKPRIEKLAGFLQQFAEINLQLDGHADRRGSVQINKALSQKRAEAVAAALIAAGIDGRRIHTHSYGETRARAAETDIDGTAFDRRVNITLSLDTPI